MARRIFRQGPPRNIVFVGHNMRDYWQVNLLTCELLQVSLARACDLALGSEQAPCFHIARWNQFRHCFVVPCILLIPEPSIEIASDQIFSLQARGKEGMCIFSTVLRSCSMETAPEQHTFFYVRARPECNVLEEEEPRLAGRRIYDSV